MFISRLINRAINSKLLERMEQSFIGEMERAEERKLKKEEAKKVAEEQKKG